MPRTAVSAPFGDDQSLPPHPSVTSADEPEDDRPIELLDLDVHTYNCLKRSNINTIGHLLSLNHADLLNARNFTQQSYDETFAKVVELGIMMAEQPIGPFRE